MIKYRINNDFKMSILLDACGVDVAELGQVAVTIRSADGRVEFEPIVTLEGTHLGIEVKQGQCSQYGRYDVLVSYGIPDVTYDDGYRDVELGVCAAFMVVEVCAGDEPTIDMDPRYKGDSAYDVARKHGFEGTEAEWLQSLVQPAEDAAAIALHNAELADTAAVVAIREAGEATEAAQMAEGAAGVAATAAQSAFSAATQARDATTDAVTATQSAGIATAAATTAAQSADLAAGEANAATDAANMAANLAQSKANLADTAAAAAMQKVVELDEWYGSFDGVKAEIVSEEDYDINI